MKKDFFTGQSYRIKGRRVPWWLAGLLTVVGAAAGFGADRLMPGASDMSAYPVREKGGDKYNFIDPLLTFETPESDAGSALASLKSAISAAVAQRIRDQDADKVSVYVRALNSGRWIGINADEHYNPASLLKVPTLIAFFKLAESNPEILSKKIGYAGNFDDNKAEHFRPAKTIAPGASYTVEELIHAMIAYSDNNATRLLHENINPALLQKVYNDLGIPISESGRADDFMTASQYTYFFRVLYNATYLGRDFSEKALALLREPDFPPGIQAGVPAGVSLVHKFGERTIVDTHGAVIGRELHDCGIVYYPLHPYLLCIMTRGSDFDRLAGVIQSISRLVYQDRDRKYGK